MLYFITGKPRHGKGLYSLSTIEKKAQAENRQVYYMGIEGLKLDWKQLDKIEDWPHLPHGAIIVFDECHKFFPQEKVGSTLPHHVEFLAEHAHNGYDMYFITQSPKRVSTFLRDRIEEHHHLIRIFGREKANLYKFYDIQTIPLSAKAKEDGIKSTFEYPKQLYGQYNSSNFHNVSKSVPLRYYAIYPIFACVLGLSYFAYTGLTSSNSTEPDATLTTVSPLVKTSSEKVPLKRNDEPITLSEYIVLNTPRLPDLPYSAPKYDKITEPDTAPFPAACVLIRNHCQCYSQQATKLSVSDSTCRQIVSNGLFIDFEANPNQQDDNRSYGSTTASGDWVEPHVDVQPYNLSDTPARASPNNSSAV